SLTNEEKNTLFVYFPPPVEDILRVKLDIPLVEEPLKKHTATAQEVTPFLANDRFIDMCEWMNNDMQKRMAKYKSEDLNTRAINMIESSNWRRNDEIVPKLEDFVTEFYLKAAKYAGFPISLNTDMGCEAKPPFYFIQDSGPRIKVYYSETKKTWDELKKEKPYTELNYLFEFGSLIAIGEMNLKDHFGLDKILTPAIFGKKQQAAKALCELGNEAPAFILFVQSDFFPEKNSSQHWLKKRLNDYEALNGQLVRTCVSYNQLKERIDSLRYDKNRLLSNAKA
ncbi:MAG: hypothetical protein V1831_00145, partial [Candidatus Woesearchaeota archaeon]